MQKLFENMTHEQADLCALILSASGVAYTTTRSENSWEIRVNAQDYEYALDRIKTYFRENPEAPPRLPVVPDQIAKVYTGVWAALALMLFHMAVAYHGVSQQLVQNFGAAADRIMAGETHRAVTALMLHSDLLHLGGNMLGIAIFGSAVCTVTRPGAGCFLILLTGIFGNLANAALHEYGHWSIGASTAVFGAIGLLSAFQFWDKFNRPGLRIKAWLPLAGGFALLGILGTGGQRTDMMAHLLGLLAGIGLGTIYALWVRAPLSDRYQTGCWFLTISILTISWFR